MMVDEDMAKDPAWERHRQSLAVQARLVRKYSSLMGALLELAVDWLSDPDASGRELGDPAAVERAAARLVDLLAKDDSGDTGWVDDLRPALRLQAALHWYVLRGDERVADLQPYFATVDKDSRARKPDDEFSARVLAAIDALGEELFERARNWHVVSNESSRGLAWLLPAVLVAAEEIHLVELGCSVGLNLYAEQRHFDLAWAASKRLRLGRGEPEHLLTLCEGHTPGELDEFSEAERRGPDVLTRVGGSNKGLDLANPDAHTYLEACIWGDQKRRIDQLRRGFRIHESAVELGIEPATIRHLDLPGELPEFLVEAVPKKPVAPLLIYHTYVTAYLSDVDQRAVARELRGFARRWSLQHSLPVMWVRLEPSRSGKVPPHPGWCLWQVDLFSGSRHKVLELGWAHPHLIRAEFGPDIEVLRVLRNRR